ncbi:unnamed protein product [Caretta caretta]
MARPKWSWATMRPGRQDPAQERNRAGWHWGSSGPRSPALISSRRHRPARSLRTFQPSQGRRWRIPVPAPASSALAPWDSSSEWNSGSSEADGRFCFVPGTTRDLEDDQEEERVDVVTEEAALKNILEQLPGQEKDEAQQLMFLHAIHPACLAAQQRGQDTLETHCCKAAVEERIVELIEELPDDSPPGAVLSNSLIAVGNLSTMTPTLEPALETHLLRAALHAVFTLGTEKDTTQVQDLHRVLPDVLDAMLGNPLAKSPDTNRLHYTLENSSEFLRMAHHVAQLALFVGDPAKDITQQAREAVYRLYQLLLHQRD